MKLAEALSILAKAPAHAKPLPVLLACGFTPLHLQNYLAAHLQTANPGHKVKIETGLFDDLAGTLREFAAVGVGSAAVALEWADLDPRLGFRQTGGWGQRAVPAILENVGARLAQLEASIAALGSASKVVLSLPTLDLPPAFHTTGWQASEAEILLNQMLNGFAARIVAHPSVVLVNSQRLALVSPPANRYDFRSDLNTGFPYTQAHAEALANGLARLLATPEPKKGLITDLDDTVWHGLVGEIGATEVSWDLASHSQIHGLYQQVLRALAEQGVLVAIASKNSPAVADQALQRSDLVLDRDKIFPIEVHWDAKSGSVARILKTWNIAAESVVFIDDSPMELAEVKAVHPGMDCILFPKGDYPAGLALLHQLRDLFGKPRLSEEDGFRLASIRQGQQFAALSNSATATIDLLATAEAIISFELQHDSADKRLLELVNKTNQFNLNGRRLTDLDWHEALQAPGSFLMSVSYEDKFGPLGKIAALQGRRLPADLQQPSALLVDSWVMSCRAFSRHIEYQILAQIFEQFKVDALLFAYAATAKNQPITDYLQTLAGTSLDSVGAGLESKVRLTRDQFNGKCPALYHQVKFKQ